VGAVSDYPGVRGVEEVQASADLHALWETPKWKGCEACDVCGSVAEWLVTKAAVGKKVVAPKIAYAAAGPVDESLKEYLREWRRSVAKEMKLAAFLLCCTILLWTRFAGGAEILERIGWRFRGSARRRRRPTGGKFWRLWKDFERENERVELSRSPNPGGDFAIVERRKNFGRDCADSGTANVDGGECGRGLVETGQVEFQAAWVSKERAVRD